MKTELRSGPQKLDGGLDVIRQLVDGLNLNAKGTQSMSKRRRNHSAAFCIPSEQFGQNNLIN